MAAPLKSDLKTNMIGLLDNLGELVLEERLARFLVVSLDRQGGICVSAAGFDYTTDVLGVLQIAAGMTARKILE